MRRGGAVDVVAEAILAEDGSKRAHPGGVVGLVEIQHDGDARLNVDPMDDGRSSGGSGNTQHVGDDGAGVVGVRGGGRGRGGHGDGGGDELKEQQRKIRIVDHLIPCKR